MVTCPNCQTPNRPGARFCVRCGAALPPVPMLPPRGTVQAWLSQAQQTLALAWQQGSAETRALYDEWIAQRPAVTGVLIAVPQSTQVTVVMQGLFGPVPFSAGANQQPGLLLQVETSSGNSVDVVMVGAHQGALPQRGDQVNVWGQWDAGMNAYRAWRVRVVPRGGQPANLELTTGRPFPLAMLSLVLLAFVLLSCLCSLFARMW